jgi:hypothetical protein
MRKITKTKNCKQTVCGFTCIPTENRCLVNKPEIDEKTKKLISHIKEESQKRISSSLDYLKILEVLVKEESKDSIKRQWVTHEEKRSVLDWFHGGQKSLPDVARYNSAEIDELWKTIDTFDRGIKFGLKTKLKNKGHPQGRFQKTMTPTERGKFILGLFISSGKRCTVTGEKHDFKELEPDHKDPKLGETPENICLVFAPINKHKGKKTWEEYAEFLETYDPDKAEKRSLKQAASSAGMMADYADRIKNGTLISGLTEKIPPEFNSRFRLKGLLKLLSTSSIGSYAIFPAPDGRTDIGTPQDAYTLLRYRAGLISLEQIPDELVNRLMTGKKSKEDVLIKIKKVFNPDVPLEISPLYTQDINNRWTKIKLAK